MKKLFAITLPVLVLTIAALAMIVEVTLRATWDPARGRPGFYVADPIRLEKLSANYDGWFAGVPVRTNAFGFRDTRDYALGKRPDTLRILVLGDSVTFGHGSVFEHTYPYLLEQRLRGWNAGVDWQVWNLGVPGYNTSQELAHLVEVGPAYRPDLVVVGFFWNDLADNQPIEPVGRRALVTSVVKTWLKQRLYSFDFYKKEYLTLRYRLSPSAGARVVLDNLAIQEQLLTKRSIVASLKEQQLTNPAPFSAEDLDRVRCAVPEGIRLTADDLERMPGIDAWKAAVRRFQDLNRAGTYRIVFFVNAAPAVCRTGDVFDPTGTKALDDYYLRVLSDGTPAVSSHDAFLRYRPSEMPLAGAHSIGNSNAIKARVLFEFLRDRVLPGLLEARRLQTS